MNDQNLNKSANSYTTNNQNFDWILIIKKKKINVKQEIIFLHLRPTSDFFSYLKVSTVCGLPHQFEIDMPDLKVLVTQKMFISSDPLVLTGQSESLCKARLRYYQTYLHMCHWYKTVPWEEDKYSSIRFNISYRNFS